MKQWLMSKVPNGKEVFATFRKEAKHRKNGKSTATPVLRTSWLIACESGEADKAPNGSQKPQEISRKRQSDGYYICLLAATKECRRLQLMVQLFNDLFSSSIFYFKCCFINVATLMFYSAIVLRNMSPIKSVIYFSFAVNAIIAFVITFSKAFQVPGDFVEMKRNILFLSRKLSAAEEKRIITRLLKSIPDVGVKIGRFQTFERTSTPTFFDFIVNNVVSLLVAHPA
ncbi:unnamed protein product [Allacma fusca]|uniref:Uncharacterized protein n=1 Tax=Allacma fusca TaxID=39272 RepID=A0A8J2KF76_9HEXA|nr:unnamed protein product [Allacma fusca]